MFLPVFEPCERRQVMSATGLLPRFDIGSPQVVDIWVDPAAGVDQRGGATRDQAVRTLAEAWRRVPVDEPLAVGVRINLVAGSYPEAIVPGYWENRRGTFAAPVIVRAADGPGTARLPAMNVFGCSYLYLDGLELSAGGGDVLHLEACSHVLVRDTTIRGTGDISTYAAPRETFKANQCQHVFVEGCDISGAFDNAVDFVAVQYGHIVGSRIHRAGDWAVYVKGGSAGLTVTGNEIFDAGTGGFTAGQGTGFEFMVSPWIHYEASDIVFTNNVIHDTEGAGMGVNGGFNVLLAHNTLFRVGRRSHVIEVVFGSRTCDGDSATCREFLAAGGWGTTTIGADEPIPNRNVSIVNNVVLNPDGYASRWEQLAVARPRQPSAGSNIPAPAEADVGLDIRGNVIWNGPADHPLGIEADVLAAAVRAGNAINVVRPVLVDPDRGDYRLAADLDMPAAVPLPAFSWADAPTRPAAPVGRTAVSLPYDHAGAARSGPQLPGAFAGGGTVAPPPVDTEPPRVVAVIPPAAAGYRRGDIMTFRVHFSEPVAVVGTPRLAVKIGVLVRSVAYASGSGTAELVFRYTIGPTDKAPGGVKLKGSVVMPAGATILDAAGNPAVVGFAPVWLGGVRVMPTRRR